MILDATKKAEQRALLEAELEAVGIRLNREPPYELDLASSLGCAMLTGVGTST